MKDDLWSEKTELLNLRLSKLARAKVLLQVEFDTEDQVLFIICFYIIYCWPLSVMGASLIGYAPYHHYHWGFQVGAGAELDKIAYYYAKIQNPKKNY